MNNDNVFAELIFQISLHGQHSIERISMGYIPASGQLSMPRGD